MTPLPFLGTLYGNNNFNQITWDKQTYNRKEGQ